MKPIMATGSKDQDRDIFGGEGLFCLPCILCHLNFEAGFFKFKVSHAINEQITSIIKLKKIKVNMLKINCISI